MPSSSVARNATSERTPGTVEERTLVWSGGVVDIKVPVRAKSGIAGEGTERINYFQIGFPVPGGFVNYIIHVDDLKPYAGKNIVASAEVYRKRYADGRSFLYVDLKPVDAQPTHWITVHQYQEGKKYPADAVVLETPAPLKGRIVITKFNKR